MYWGLYMPLCPAASTGMDGVEWVRGPGDVGVLVDLFCGGSRVSTRPSFSPPPPWPWHPLTTDSSVLEGLNSFALGFSVDFFTCLWGEHKG